MLQLVGIALVGGIITVYLKSINQELALMSLICTGIIIVVTAFAYLTETFDLFRRIAEIGNVDQTLLKIVLKIVWKISALKALRTSWFLLEKLSF